MPSSPSTIFRTERMAQGENLNTWGDPKLNDALDRIEEAIAKMTALTVNANVTLTNTDYLTNQSRSAGFILSGAGGFNIIAPASPRVYVVKNGCAAAVTFTHGSGDTVSIPAGQNRLIATDGSNFFNMVVTDFSEARLQNIGAAQEDDEAVRRDQVLLLSGGTLTGALTLNAAPTEDLHPATKKYADELAFNAVDLPGQTGNDGSYLRTDGTTASWQALAVAFSAITGKPTTLSGYGITDALSNTIQTRWGLRP